ncbi:2-methyl-6-phytyl-1,4-hydroquinone methyltransferase, chloroplastic-like [Fagus crenata]
MIVVDVGGGTWFTTLGIVKHVDAKNVTILDQSPHQIAKIIECDAEDLPFKTDYADRYISAGREIWLCHSDVSILQGLFDWKSMIQKLPSEDYQLVWDL